MNSRGFKVFSLCMVLVLIGVCGSLVWPRIQYERGLTQLRLKEYGLAVIHLETAEKGLSGMVGRWFALADMFRVQSNLGKARYHLGINEWQEKGVAPEVLAFFEQGKSNLARALDIEPEDYINTYWLARTEEALEMVYPVVYPHGKNPYDALSYFQLALELRPSGISVRYVYARYLYRKGMRGKIPSIVQEMMTVYPLAYKDLKEEAFFNAALIPYVEQGLQTALRNKILARDALKSLSRVYWDQQVYGQAIQLYKDLLSGEVNQNTDADYIYMGSLLVAAGQKSEGFGYFEKVLGSKTITDEKINEIYGSFEKAGQLDEFLEFSFRARDKGLSSVGLDLCVAKSLIKADRLPFARAKLIQINAKKEDPRSYVLLAEIAEQEKDWEEMKDMAQNAQVFEPGSARVQYLLSKAFEGMGEFAKAKGFAKEAVRLDPVNREYKHQERKFGKL
jgi:tetratricopeptide (TPR) repeat protein